MGATVGRLLGLHGEIPSPGGPHLAGVLRLRPSPGSPWCQVFYPAHPDANSQAAGGVPYMRPEAARGMAKWLNLPWLGFVFAGSLQNVAHPMVADAELHPQFAPGKGKLPLFIFSHGLGGTSEMYAALCSSLASHGTLVIAVEHEDGSGSYAEDVATGEAVFYKAPPKELKYEREPVMEFRRPFLEHRKAEIKSLLALVQQLAAGRPGSAAVADDQVEFALLDSDGAGQAADRPGAGESQDAASTTFERLVRSADLERIFLGGHSFGAATTVHAAHDADVASALRGAVLLDLWPFPLPHEHVERGMPIETLSILTEQFVTNGEVGITLEMIANSNSSSKRVHSYFIPGTTHQQYSDAPWFMSARTGAKMQAVGSTPREVSQTALVESITAFIGGERDFSRLEREHPLERVEPDQGFKAAAASGPLPEASQRATS